MKADNFISYFSHTPSLTAVIIGIYRRVRPTNFPKMLLIMYSCSRLADLAQGFNRGGLELWRI